MINPTTKCPTLLPSFCPSKIPILHANLTPNNRLSNREAYCWIIDSAIIVSLDIAYSQAFHGGQPSLAPSSSPSSTQSSQLPSIKPTNIPSTIDPTSDPTVMPTTGTPSVRLTTAPSALPSMDPTFQCLASIPLQQLPHVLPHLYRRLRQQYNLLINRPSIRRLSHQRVNRQHSNQPPFHQQ